MKNIFYGKDYDKKLNAICKGGLDSLWVLADFDKTFTKAFVNGKDRGALISILYSNDGYLSPDVQILSRGLFQKYHPIEIDSKLTLQEKKKYMQERREKTFQVLIDNGLTQDTIKKAMQNGGVKLRFGVKKFLKLLDVCSIPLIILSSGGLGKYSIEQYLIQRNLLKSNVYIVGNELIWNDKGEFVDYKRPIIHSLNKDGSSIPKLIKDNQLKNRGNIILIGDSIGDLDMAKGYHYNEILKIGFLNENKGNRLQQYRENFDIVIVNDGSFCGINEILKKISFMLK